MRAAGRVQREGVLSEFLIMGPGGPRGGRQNAFDTPFLAGYGPTRSNVSAGRTRLIGRNDRDLPAEFQTCGGGRRQPYRQAMAIVGANLAPSRRPTPAYEGAFLGLGNLRYNERDWARDIPYPLSRLEAPYGYGIARQDTRPFQDEVTAPWIRAIQQETYAQVNRSLRIPWLR